MNNDHPITINNGEVRVHGHDIFMIAKGHGIAPKTFAKMLKELGIHIILECKEVRGSIHKGEVKNKEQLDRLLKVKHIDEHVLEIVQ